MCLTLCRYMQATFLDTKKQEAIQQLLGLHSGVSAFCNSPLAPPPDAPSQLVDRKHLDLRALTYNVNARATGMGSNMGQSAQLTFSPDAFRVQDLLRLVQTPAAQPPPHVFVFALQEIVDLTPGKVQIAAVAVGVNNLLQVLSNSASDVALANWATFLTGLLDALLPRAYVLISSSCLVGLGLLVFVQSSLLPLVRDVHHDEVRVGLRGMAGNKGACGVRFQLCSSLVECLACHLAAGEGQKAAEQRNQDFFSVRSMMFSSLPRVASSSSHLQVPLNSRALFFPCIADRSCYVTMQLWLGDFNYRLEMSLPEALAELSQYGGARLLQQDQLSYFRSQGAVFGGFEEAPITFPPTYKYDIGSDRFDSSPKARVLLLCHRLPPLILTGSLLSPVFVILLTFLLLAYPPCRLPPGAIACCTPLPWTRCPPTAPINAPLITTPPTAW
jgi:hypothetical protein